MALSRFLQTMLGSAGICLLVSATVLQAQDTREAYSDRRALNGFVEYSNDSSHMLLGYAEGRKIAAIGMGWERRSFLRDNVSGAWVAEVRPLMRVSDPTMKGFSLQFPQQPAYSGVVDFKSAIPVEKPVTSTPFNVVMIAQSQLYAGTGTYIAGTRSTYVSALSPLGYRLKFLPHSRVQPFVTGLGGFAVAPRAIPVFNSSAFNLTFEVGAGVQVYRSHTRSCVFEYRYHHLANGGGAAENPGIDSGVFKVAYSFGR